MNIHLSNVDGQGNLENNQIIFQAQKYQVRSVLSQVNVLQFYSNTISTSNIKVLNNLLSTFSKIL